ncbi:hypothetical protein IE53DRAFT_408174 [Violaceomyces palustris]|uniref:Uncharacterized protein n=1 Tax=Violaceomyces palustris TaxID=1673888 RepID=A0ACD0P7S9_9BASI|nr:hypothetical protein IE53DRAFT_408174 [Violaceomyces palustris]
MKYFLAISAFTPVFVLLSSLTITAGAESFADTLVLNLSQKCRTALINLNTDATLSECTGNGDQLALFTQTGNILPDLLDFFNSVYCNRDCGPSIPKILKSISEECADDMDYNDGYNLVRGFTNYYSNYYGYRNMFCMRESNNASSNCGLSYVQKISEITGLVPNVTNAVYFVVNTTLQEKLSQIFTDNSTFLCNDCNKAMFTVMKYGPAAMSGSGWEGSVLSTLPPKVCRCPWPDTISELGDKME